MAQKAVTIANGARKTYAGGAMKKMIYDPDTGDFMMIEKAAPVEEGIVVDDFSKDGFAL